jgi:hypothetical protein
MQPLSVVVFSRVATKKVVFFEENGIITLTPFFSKSRVLIIWLGFFQTEKCL